MFKKGETRLYLMAIVGVVAIFLIVLLSQNGLPSFDGDLTGDAKRALVQKNVQQASSGNVLANRGVVERVPVKKVPSVAKAPVRYGDQEEVMTMPGEEYFEELVQDCLENGYYNPATYSWDYTPTLAECQEWAESQIQNASVGDSCLPGQISRTHAASYDTNGCLEVVYWVLVCGDDGKYRAAGAGQTESEFLGNC